MSKIDKKEFIHLAILASKATEEELAMLAEVVAHEFEKRNAKTIIELQSVDVKAN